VSEAEWLPFEELVKIVLARFKTSVGYAESIVRKALASGDVRPRPLTANEESLEEILRANLLFVSPRHYSVDDFQDWLDRHPPEARPADKQKPTETPRIAKAKAKAACIDWLVALRKNGPPKKTKEEYYTVALERWSNLGPWQFRNAWEEAARRAPNKEGWGEAGRPKGRA
jgi:hypothetical protein